MSWDEFDILGNLDSSDIEDHLSLEGNQRYDNVFDEDDFIDLSDLDFSALTGKNFKKDFKAINKATRGKKVVTKSSKTTTKTPRLRLGKTPKKSLIKSKVEPINVGVKRSAVIRSKFGKPTTQRVIVPDDREVIVEGVDSFILSNTKESDAIRNLSLIHI